MLWPHKLLEESWAGIMYKSLAHNYQIENLETVFVKIFSKTKQILSAQYIRTLR